LLPAPNRAAARDQVLLGFSVTISPDGKAAAVIGTYGHASKIPVPDLGLYLVDLASPERKVTKVPSLASG
jgi:hypothetical protein